MFLLKSLFETKEMLKNLKRDRDNCKSSTRVKSETNHNEGWIEGLEIILDLYDRNRIEVANRRILEYKSFLLSRYQNDLDVYGKDITNGWLEGSIEAINWFFEN